MMLSGKTVLVTGATGFIGDRVVEKLILEHGANVRVVIRNYSSASRLARFPIDIRRVDLADAEAVREAARGCDVVMHCAHETLWDPAAGEYTAETATRNIGEAVLSEGVERLVHLSSYAVYGNALDGDLTESTAWQPADHTYTDAKRRTETLVLEMHKQRGLPVVVLQPTIVYGPFGQAWTQGPLEHLKTGVVPLVDGGHGYCNAVYVDDVVEAMFLAAVRPNVLGETFLVSGDEPVTWKTFYQAFESIVGFESTKSVSAEEIRKLQIQKAREKKPLPQLMALVRQPDVIWTLLRVPPLSWAKNGIRALVPRGRRAQVVSSVVRPVGQNRNNGVAEKPLHVPNKTLLGVYRPRAHVRIDKARQLLEYQPQVSFSHGMERTAHYARWARLV